MDPRDASVYSDTWSTLTWVLILSTIIVFVFALMITFIVMVQRSIDHSVDVPRSPRVPEALEAADTDRPVATPPHAA